MLITASTKNKPEPRSAPTMPGASGIAASAAMYGRIATTGAHSNTVLSAAAGVTLSFWTNFTPSATSWAQPWNPPAYIGPSRDCMWAITLCSAWPTSNGATRNATSTPTTRTTNSTMSAPYRLILDLNHCSGRRVKQTDRDKIGLRLMTVPRTILVTGATGRVGRHVVAGLREAGVTVRALVRNPLLAGLPSEVEIVTGDITDPDAVQRAAADVEAAFLLWPFFSAEGAAPVVEALAKHVSRVV